MTKKRRRLSKNLRLAQGRRDCLRVIRTIEKAERVDGYLVAVGKRWLLLFTQREGDPSGYVALPLRTLRRISRAPGRRFVRRSFQAHSAWPPAAPTVFIDLDRGVRELIDSAAAGFPLVTLFTECDHPGVCYIGQPVRWGRRKLHLQEVDPRGRWQRKPAPHRIASITRVDFGGRYETNLATVAGTRPPL